MSKIISDEEKETLKQEVLVELEKQALKKEIVQDLQPTAWNASLARFAQHPAFLLFISFALTGLIGSWLTSSWQSREWDRQQLRLVKIKSIDQKYEVTDEVIKAVGQSNSEVMDALNFLRRSDIFDVQRTEFKKELEENRAAWAKGYKNWHINSSILDEKLKVYFRDIVIESRFKSIMERRQMIKIGIDGLFDYYKSIDVEGFQIDQRTEDEIYSFLKSDSSDMKVLIANMKDEIRVDIEGNR